MTQLTIVKQNTPLAPIGGNDGWADAAADAGDRVLRGSLLKFSDGQWTSGTEGNEVRKGLRLLAIGTAHAWVRWRDGKPDEYRVRQAGESLAEREELGDLDESKWELGPDKRARDPWQNTRFVYLIDPNTQEAYTFSTSSWGGRSAVIDLGDAIQRKRFTHSEAIAEVELNSAPMQTKFGRKSRPVFKIVAWRSGLDDEAEVETRSAPKLVSSQARGDMDDEIPF
jgi:hypothetical protein